LNLFLKNHFDNLYNKVRDYLKENGGDAKFSPNSELICIINKISFDKEKSDIFEEFGLI